MAPLDKSGTGGDSREPALGHVAGCTLFEKLAEGPMSTVYRAEDGSGREVVVKLLSDHANRIAEKLSVKLGKPWEGEKARMLNHPNVVHTYACGKEKGSYYIVMEYLPGGSFAEHLRMRRQDILARRLEILAAAAHGLAYVHEKGIIHRDVCPKNLLFDKDGVVKLIDFGVSILKSDRLRQTEVRTGRPSYLAPELIRHNRFNVQTDIYAFGVTLYEAFTGQRPFTAESREDILNLHLRADPRPLSQLDPTLHPMVDQVVLKALAKTPTQRYVTMKQVLVALAGLRGLVT